MTATRRTSRNVSSPRRTPRNVSTPPWSALIRGKGRHESAGARKRATAAGRRERRGLRKRALALRAAVALPIAVAALGIGGWWVTTSSIFRAHRVVVVGSSHLARAEVLRAGGVDGSTNVMWTAPSAIESSLESNPWIASAAVTRDLPSTLRIRITERTPASTVMIGSTWFLVAGDGTVLGPARGRPHLPVLPTTESVIVGARSRALAAPAAVAGSMDPWLRARVAYVTPAHDGSIQFALDDGARVLFGPPTEVEAKDEALMGILRWAAHRGAHLATIDVTSPIAPSAVPVA